MTTLVRSDSGELEFFDTARKALERAATIDEVKEIHDQAEALRLYTRQSKQSHTMQNQVAEIKLRAERKAGELIAALPKASPGPNRDSSHDGKKLSLEEAGISTSTAHRWEKVAAVPEREFEEYIADTRQTEVGEITTAGLLRAKRTDQALRMSESNEWYTPARYIEAARLVMGSIDLDPASSELANETVQAAEIYTIENDGLDQDWFGRVWLNPPYGGGSAAFTEKLVHEYDLRNVTEAILLVNANSTDTNWFQPLWDHTLCFTHGRINFVSPAGKQSGSTHGSVFVYFGDNWQGFAGVFSQFGAVVRRV